MSATMTMKRIEDQVRMNHINDRVETYRWASYIVLSFIYDSIEELCKTMNPWAQYNQETGNLLSPYNVPSAKTLDVDSTAGDITAVQALVIPVDDRFEQCLVRLTASKCFGIDDSDLANAEKANSLYADAGRYAQS